MNCGICKSCLAHSRGIPKKGMVSHCPSCLPRNKNCYIKRGCRKFRRKEIESCIECDSVPCENLDRLDRRYRRLYGMSMVENLKEIGENRMEKFIEKQEKTYRCSKCGDVVSVHDGKCYRYLKS